MAAFVDGVEKEEEEDEEEEGGLGNADRLTKYSGTRVPFTLNLMQFPQFWCKKYKLIFEFNSLLLLSDFNVELLVCGLFWLKFFLLSISTISSSFITAP